MATAIPTANLPQDALYWLSFANSTGVPYSGANNYVLHFGNNSTPPAYGFRSVTLYGPDGYPVSNPINRYAISSWMPLKKNADGSIDIYVQRNSPGKDKQANWLPAAEKDFNVTMRIYWPKDKAPSILDGTWKPPAIVRAQ